MSLDIGATTIELQSADQLLAALAQAETKQRFPFGSLLYRGLADASYELQPTAYRDVGEQRLARLLELQPVKYPNGALAALAGATTHMQAEMQALGLFYRMANLQGLPLPQLPQDLHEALLHPVVGTGSIRAFQMTTNEAQLWPHPPLRPVIALAQHYGIPTRALDWTSDPHVAAYFAASRAIKKLVQGPISGQLAVWVLRRDVLDATSLFDQHREVKVKPSLSVRVIDAPYNGNPNLAAQKGVFTIVIDNRVKEKTPNDPTDKSSVLDALQRIHSEMSLEPKGKQLLPVAFSNSINMSGDLGAVAIKFTLDTKHAPDLLDRLHRQNYGGARMFPGYGGCETMLQEIEHVAMLRAGK